MTDTPAQLSSTPAATPSQKPPNAAPGLPIKDESPAKAEGGEEEPYTIKCICTFSDDDGNTIYCEACDTWQHIECFYPDNREEAIREDFAHACADCNPRPLDRKKAIDRTYRLTHAVLGDSQEKKTKRPPSKGHKKKPKPVELTNGTDGTNGILENGKQGSPTEHTAKKSKSSHKTSHSVSSLQSKRSPSYSHPKASSVHPPSPATTPPDLPDNFYIHTYTPGFRSLYEEDSVTETQNNAFSSLAIPTALSRWLRDPETMQQEVGRSADEVFQTIPPNIEEKKPKLEIEDATRQVLPSADASDEMTVRWRFIKSTSPIEKDVPLIELNGVVGFQAAYCAESENLWADLSSPLPFVFFHPSLPLYIDTRKEGSIARYVRRSCKPNAQLDTYLSGSDYHFWLVSDRHIPANEQITLPWDFRLDKSVCSRWLHLLGLSEEDASSPQMEADMHLDEYNAISNWIDRILSEYGGCACGLDNNCAFARFHRQWLFLKDRSERTQVATKSKKGRKSRGQTISPTSTGHATNSRAASEGHPDDGADDAASQSESSRSKPPSRDRTPARQGSLDKPSILTELTDREKRKVAMVEDSFRRMEQQQPPRKKKRVSDGTTASTSSKPKSRNGSVAPAGQYVDAGTSGRASGSPSVQSPNAANGHKTLSRTESSTSRARQTSKGPSTRYCDASTQTDPVQGEWFSELPSSPRPKKRVISLSRRLLSNKHRAQVDEERRQTEVRPVRIPASTAMEIDSPIEHKPTVAGLSELGEAPPAPLVSDPAMSDAANDWSPTTVADADAPKNKTPDLRVQMPPVPAFDNTGFAGTPSPASGSVVQSPFSNAITSPYPAPVVNGNSAHPSPVKKKLSLSDYTKSRMNKAAGKVPGSAMLKPSIATPDESKVDITLESVVAAKTEENMVATPVTTNGIS
ncbi:hypothetical protein NLU13_4764 [Sarocladium strictum]|uniref:SET domain-containing protein n=1 Tax=Sarocladium strictum TaxID=5046 RepID=A0AA39GJU4_SARSR|nr:hypothetical protein NLU13_4764 [Sarocladium strictum]